MGPAGAVDRHDVEAARMVKTTGPREVIERHRADTPALPPGNGFRGLAKARPAPRLDFDEDRRLAVGRDDIELAIAGAVTAGEDAKAPADEFLRGQFFADFADFGMFRLEVEKIRYIGGYGRMSWVDAGAWRAAEPDPLAADADGILRHMNEDHAEALRLYARAFTRATDAEGAIMTAVDRHGFEMSVATPTGRRPARIAFATDVTTTTAARQVLVALVKEARAKLGSRLRKPPPGA